MRTSEEVIEKLRSMKPNVHMDGRVVPRDDTRIMPALKVVLSTYDFVKDPRYEKLLTTTSHLTHTPINRFTHVPQCAEDLLAKQEMIRALCQRTGVCIQRCGGLDTVNALSVVTYEMDQELGTDYHQRFLRFLRSFQDGDLIAPICVTDVKGDRSRRPHEQADPDLYVRVVDKTVDGIIVRGAKCHINMASYSDEIIVVPTRSLVEKDSMWAVSFAIPADAEGIHIICRAKAQRPREHLQSPYANYGTCHSFVIFDDVFVPWERVFLCGETRFASRLALLTAIYHRHSYTGCKAALSELIMGASALVAEYNGVAKATHVGEKLAHLIAVGELVYAAGIAAAVQGTRSPSGTFVPNLIYTNAGRYLAGINDYAEYETLADLSGGLPATLPAEADFFEPITGPLLNKYIKRNPNISSEDQHRCFRLISEMIASTLAAHNQMSALHGGGSPVMERIGLASLYDIESRKDMIRYLAGISK